jgi:hypothetical protein
MHPVTIIWRARKPTSVWPGSKVQLGSWFGLDTLVT